MNIFNEKIKERFINELVIQGCSKGIAKKIVKEKIPLSGDKINPQILSIFREYEEQVFNQEEGDN